MFWKIVGFPLRLLWALLLTIVALVVYGLAAMLNPTEHMPLGSKDEWIKLLKFVWEGK